MRILRITALLLFGLFCSAALWAQTARIGVFIPGVREGNPIYDTMAKGAERLASEIPGLSVKVAEAGFNQADWEEKLTSFVASGNSILSLPRIPQCQNLLPM